MYDSLCDSLYDSLYDSVNCSDIKRRRRRSRTGGADLRRRRVNEGLMMGV